MERERFTRSLSPIQLCHFRYWELFKKQVILFGKIYAALKKLLYLHVAVAIHSRLKYIKTIQKVANKSCACLGYNDISVCFP